MLHRISRSLPSKILRIRSKSAFADANEISSFLRSKKTPLTPQESTTIIQHMQEKPLQCPPTLFKELLNSLKIWPNENKDELISILTQLSLNHLNDSSTIITAVTNLGYIANESKARRGLISVLDKKLDECEESIVLTGTNEILRAAKIAQSPVLLKFANKLKKSNHELDESAIVAMYIEFMYQTQDKIEYIQRLVSLLLDSTTHPFKPDNITKLFRGLNTVDNNNRATLGQQSIELYLQSLQRKVEQYSKPFPAHSLAFMLYGLRDCDTTCTQVESLLSIIVSKAYHSQDIFAPRDIGQALNGLRNMKCENATFREALVMLAEKIRLSPHPLDHISISSSFSGLKNMSSDCSEVRNVIAALGQKILYSKVALHSQAIGSALYGMKEMSSDSPEVREVIDILADKISQSTCELDAQAIANSLYGLKRMNSECVEVRKMLSVLAIKIGASKHSLSAQGIGNALFGLKNMSSSHESVRLLIQVLFPKIENSNDRISAQQISNALYGLSSMSTTYAVVRSMLALLTRKLITCESVFDSQNVCNIIYGLRFMSSSCQEVRAILSVMTPKIEMCNKDITVQSMSGLLFSLRCMSSDNAEVRKYLQVITKKINNSKMMFDSKAAAMSLTGLRNMSCQHSAVRDVISALTDKIAISKLQLNALSVGQVFYGLQSMSLDTLEVRSCVQTLYPLVQEYFSSCMESEYSPKDSIRVGMILFGLCNLLQNSKSPFNDMVEVADMIEEIRKHVHRTKSQVTDSNEMLSLWQSAVLYQGKESIPEKCAASLDGIVNDLRPMVSQFTCVSPSREYENDVASLIRGRTCGVDARCWKIHTNVMLHGFEADILVDMCGNYNVTNTLSSKDQKLINIELDGKSHYDDTKKKFYIARDIYLSTKLNIVVKRMNLDDFKSIHDLVSNCMNMLNRYSS